MFKAVDGRQFEFDEQLDVGKRVEELFALNYPDLSLLNGIEGDFLLPDGRKMEIKADFHDEVNFFFERWSRDKRAGGPWQSLGHGAHVFVIYFVKTNTWYSFDCAELVEILNDICEYKQLISIRNNGFTSSGYIVPITDLESYWTKGHLDILKLVERAKQGAA